MKTYTITNIDYSGEDFCGEVSPSEAYKIISEQPKELTIILQDDVYEGYLSYDEDDSFVESIVSDYCYENGILSPTSFDFSLAD